MPQFQYLNKRNNDIPQWVITWIMQDVKHLAKGLAYTKPSVDSTTLGTQQVLNQRLQWRPCNLSQADEGQLKNEERQHAEISAFHCPMLPFCVSLGVHPCRFWGCSGGGSSTEVEGRVEGTCRAGMKTRGLVQPQHTGLSVFVQLDGFQCSKAYRPSFFPQGVSLLSGCKSRTQIWIMNW